MESEWIEAAFSPGRYVTDSRKNTIIYCAAVLTTSILSVVSRSVGQQNSIIGSVKHTSSLQLWNPNIY